MPPDWLQELEEEQRKEERRGKNGAESEGNGQAPPDDSLILDPSDPLPSARVFLRRHYQHEEAQTLLHHCGTFYQWNGAAYEALDEASVRAALYPFLEAARRPGKGAKPFQPNAARVNNVIDALKAAANVSATIAPPAWLTPHSLAAADMLPCGNGLLHLPTLTLLPASPAYFGFGALDYGYEAGAPDPAEWLAFLAELWPNDPEAIACLQEIFGYVLTHDTRQQKIFLLIGPRRSGRGTIARVMTAMLGQANICAPTFAGVAQQFGLAPLIGKRLAIIGDARIGARTDQAVIAERLLSISGEDWLTIDRKFLPAWTGRLPTRFLILSNELPRLTDASGALAGRFILLILERSFYGREDHGLTGRLLRELPGILNWAIAGLRRLNERGRFEQPESAKEALEDLEALGSPIGAFVRERCIVEPGRRITPQALFDAWKLWCEAQNRRHPGTVHSFGRDLRAAVPGLRISQPRHPKLGVPIRHYEGIDLRYRATETR